MRAASAALGRKRKAGHKGPGRRALEGALLGLLVAGVFAGLGSFGALDALENRLWDLRVRAFARPSEATDRIRLILLDQGSLDWAEKELGVPWPWPREFYGVIVSFLTRSGARAAAFDVLYTETSFYGVEDDESFAAAVRESGRTVAAVQLSREQGKDLSWPSGAAEPPSAALNGVSLADLPRGVFPIPELSAAAAALGNVLAVPDPDGVNRALAPAARFDGLTVPTLALAAYCLGEGIRDLEFRPGAVKAGSRSIPLSADGHVILRYRGPSQTHRTVNAGAVLRSETALRDGGTPEIDPEFFSDRYVFFGFSAPGLKDLRPAPVGETYPGVEVHATLLDNILAGDAVRPLPLWASAVLVLVLGMAAGAAIRLCRDALQSAAVLAAALALPFAAAWIAAAFGIWAPAAAPEGAVLFALIGGFVVNYAGEGRQKRFIKEAFSQYLSPVVIERLVHDPDKLTLGGEKRCLSILFSDIRGFTSISEGLDPVSLTALLNDYLSEVTEIIYRFGGTIDKYEGDAVIAFWNAPLDLPTHALNSVKAALEYQKRLAEIRPRLAETAGRDVYARIGINTGDVVIGNMGSRQRFNYTFLGDAGNLASRLEGINKQFGTFVMVSEFTKAAAGEDPEVSYRELSRVTVVGKSEPVRVFEPLYRDEYERRAEVLERFGRGLGLYYAGDFRKALGEFEAIRDRDAPAAAYFERVGRLLADPPREWDGVWAITEK